MSTQTLSPPTTPTLPTTGPSFPMPLGAEDIRRLVPHRWPFLFLDRVTALEPGLRATGIKNVSVSEPYFAGHLPVESIMPGVLVIETAAQLSGVVIATAVMENPGAFASSFAFLAGVKKFRFRQPVRPGDQLVITTQRVASLANVADFRVEARVDGTIVADGLITFAGKEIAG